MLREWGPVAEQRSILAAYLRGRPGLYDLLDDLEENAGGVAMFLVEDLEEASRFLLPPGVTWPVQRPLANDPKAEKAINETGLAKWLHAYLHG